ncbi:exostosin domain-containing protein [Alteromonas antoniana]|uniref:exostosin domain-containing protein n=1 Tax=Alteromonas antoniana TaxID=2803813 RepID=UPI001C482EC0|nr:exostosin family protein [Alteromonas antoniana]
MEKFVVYDADWQTPARTEQYVYESLSNDAEILDNAVYVAFPWANLIDGLARQTELGSRLLVEYEKLVAECKNISGKRIVTACQHIKFKDYYNLFYDIGITDLFVSHKEKGQTNLGAINLYPLQLFPVQAASEIKELYEVADSITEFQNREYLFSFVGAYDGRYYLTDSRKHIFEELKGCSGGLVTERLSWHYQARVYDEQVYGKSLSSEYLTEEQRNAVEYINVMQNSKFSLCPSGTGPNSIRLWESLEYECIPVILADTLDLPSDQSLWEEACVFIKEDKHSIAKIPEILKKIESDSDLLKQKLSALKELKRTLGLENFSSHIRQELDLINDKSHSGKSLTLVCANISDAQAYEWLSYLESVFNFFSYDFSVRVVGFEAIDVNKYDFSIHKLNSCQFDFSQDFVTLFDSKTLSAPILDKFDNFFLIPKSAPKLKNKQLYKLISEQESESESKCWSPRATIITSMFNGDEYKDGFLDNVGKFSNLEELENFIFRPQSRGKEHEDIVEFGLRHSSTVYFWLKQDPGLYDVWNFAARISSSKYLTNANIDDKRAPLHIASLTEALDQNADCDVASSGLRVTDTKNLSWEESSDEMVWYTPKTPTKYSVEKLAKYNDQQNVMQAHNIPHCMPVWRTKLHRENGYFNERRFGPSSDWEFWLRCGKNSSQFYLLDQSYGLYYRAPQSYWRRDPNAKNYDLVISKEYFSGDVLRASPFTANLNAPKFSELLNSFAKSDYYHGISLLFEVARIPNKTQSEKDLIERISSYYLEVGYSDIVDAAQRLEPVRETKDIYADLLGCYLRALKTPSEGLLKRLLLCADKVVSADNDLLGWLFFAKIYNVAGELEKESLCLSNAYKVDSYEFWCSVNRFYGCEYSLKYFIDLLEDYTDVPLMSDLSWVPKDGSGTIYFLPDYTHGNPYQTLLYQNLVKSGVSVSGLSENDSINLDLDKFKTRDVLHIHWINVLFRGHTLDTLPSYLNSFIDKLKELKEKGVKLVWTVHNRANHEQIHKPTELAFRRELTQLCDVVLLHHPMLKAEISEWLHKDAHIEIIEHGLYQKNYPNNIGRKDARNTLKLTGEELAITTLGQVREYKNLDEKVTLVDELLNRDGLKIKYLIAGRVSCKNTLEALSKSHSNIVCENRFINDDEIQIYLNAADFVLLTYRDILTSGSLFQSLTFYKDVIAPSLGSIKYYVSDGINGYLYDEIMSLESILKKLAENGALLNGKSRMMMPCWPDF